MKKLILLTLLIVGCDLLQEEDVRGCTDSNAINYSPNATVSDNTCEYSVYGGYPDFETICGMDERGNPTDDNWKGDDGICGLCLGQIEIEYETLFQPIQSELVPPYPNPFYQNTYITFWIASDIYTKVYILNIDYNVIDTLIQDTLDGGHTYHIWDATNFPDGYYRIIGDFGDVECFYNMHKFSSP